MKIWLRRLAVLAPLVTLAGCTVVKAPPPPDAPRISSFTTSAQVVNAGEEVRLSFNTAGATSVSLVDDQGQAIQLEGTVDEGGAGVSPLRTTFYVLRAAGPGGVASAFVQIAVNEPLREAFLVAVPPEIEAGERAQLLWSAPGANSVTLTERGGQPMTLTGTSGTVPVTPLTSTGFRLTAQGVAGTPPVDALTEITVRPAIGDFALEALNGVQPGETLTFTWETRAAQRVVLSERTLGRLTELTDPAEVGSGSFDWVVPATVPSGMSITDGFPFRFALSAISGPDTSSRELSAVVGNLPAIERLVVPPAVSVGKTFLLEWRTANATRVSVKLGGFTLFETLPSDPGRAVEGSVALPAPQADADYVLVASDDRGQVAQRTVRLRVVMPPTITSFTVPATASAPGTPVTAQWVTANAESVIVRLERGPSLARVTTLSAVRQGSVSFTPVSSASITLEAINAAGDLASETRLVNVSGPVAFVTPSPVFRSSTGSATLEWQLAALGTTQVDGLDTPPPAAVTGSTAFIDLATSPTATELSFASPLDGAERANVGEGFSFPLAGLLQRELWVSVNGFIAFSKPAALSSNADLGSSSNSTQSMLAVLWDDLTLPPTGKVLYELKASSTGERFAVVQWEKLHFASNVNSELTFQAHLYESGRVTYVYKTLTGTLTSLTAGVKATHENVRRAYQYNTTGGPIAPALELNYFTGAPADGTLEVGVGSTRRINFLGQSPGGVQVASALVSTLGAGDVRINEALPVPDLAVVTTGQWVELRNMTSGPLNLDGLTLTSTGSADGGGTLLSGVLPVGGMKVYGQSTDLMETGGAAVDAVWTDLPLAATDTLRVRLGTGVVSTLGWSNVTTPVSVLPAVGYLSTGDAGITCVRTDTFGMGSALGTPGAENAACGPYLAQEIPPSLSDRPSGATVFTLTGSLDEGRSAFTLPQPFTYFGAAITTGTVTTNGYLSMGAALTSSYYTNHSTVSTALPNGVIAPFWDDLQGNAGATIAMWRDGTRTVFEWNDFTIYTATSNPGTSRFQVHLLDSGVIEFHYGTFEAVNASTMDRFSGSSAFIGLENTTGTVMVPHSINTLGARPQGGVRFTPNP